MHGTIGRSIEPGPKKPEKFQSLYSAGMTRQRFIFGDFVLDAARGTLARRGEPLPVGQKGILLLAALLSRAGEVVSKAELLDEAWSGAAIEESNLSVQIAALRKAARSGTKRRRVDRDRPARRLPLRRRRRRAGSAVAERARRAGRQSTRPSIAVLPFANLGDDHEDDYFADGLTEDIITALSGLRWLRVAARNSSFAYRARDTGVAARELGVRYLLGGSVRRSRERVRISAQLTDAAALTQIWADRYDGELTDFFALQDRITASVVSAIEPFLFGAEASRARPKTPQSLDAWGFVMRAMPHIWTSAADDNQSRGRLFAAGSQRSTPAMPAPNALLAWVLCPAAQSRLGSVRRSPREPRSPLPGMQLPRIGRRCLGPSRARLIHSDVAAVRARHGRIEQRRSRSIRASPLRTRCSAWPTPMSAIPIVGLQELALALRLSPRDP